VCKSGKGDHSGRFTDIAEKDAILRRGMLTSLRGPITADLSWLGLYEPTAIRLRARFPEAQKIRMRLGGGTCVDDFPAKPQPFTSRTIFLAYAVAGEILVSGPYIVERQEGSCQLLISIASIALLMQAWP
jgi:hypothetical protein